MRSKLVELAAILSFIGPATAQSIESEWSIDPAFEFSIRCSQAPHRIEFSGLTGTFINQLYLKVENSQLSRLEYSTPTDSPHHWMKPEAPVVYRTAMNHGRSKVESKRVFRKSGSETISRIDVSLDASAAQDKLDLVASDFVTYGKWSIFKKPGTLTLQESTSIFVDGKLSQSSSTSWNNCRLMTKDGEDVYF